MADWMAQPGKYGLGLGGLFNLLCQVARLPSQVGERLL